MLTYPSGIIRETAFRPVGGAGPQILHALEIDQGLLVHTPDGLTLGSAPYF